MTPKVPLVLLCALLLGSVQALAKTALLPDACGDDKIQFDAKQEKVNPGLPALTAGKALLVFVETMPAEMTVQTTTRFGLDGAWAGATKGDSYFAVEVTPGEHGVCASMQSTPNRMKKQFTKMASFTAEAGKVYYFEAAVNMTGQMDASTANFVLAQLSEADGKYRIKAWKLATSKPKN